MSKPHTNAALARCMERMSTILHLASTFSVQMAMLTKVGEDPEILNLQLHRIPRETLPLECHEL